MSSKFEEFWFPNEACEVNLLLHDWDGEERKKYHEYSSKLVEVIKASQLELYEKVDDRP